MATITELIKKIRFRAADSDEVKYSDYDIMDKLNEANRFFRSTCMEEAPDFLCVERAGILPLGYNVINLGGTPLRVFEVRVNGKALDPSNLKSVRDTEAVGIPQVYVVCNSSGLPRLNVFPRPNQEVRYRVLFIPDTQELTKEDELTVPNDVEALFVDYVVARLATQEAEAYEELVGKLRDVLRKFTPGACVVEPYYY